MTTKRTWQKLEQRVCEKLGGRRTPLSGSNSQHGTSADCMGCTVLPGAYVETKYRKSFIHHSLFRAVATKAKNEGRLPLLVTHIGGEQGELVTLRLSDFIKLVQASDTASQPGGERTAPVRPSSGYGKKL